MFKELISCSLMKKERKYEERYKCSILKGLKQDQVKEMMIIFLFKQDLKLILLTYSMKTLRNIRMLLHLRMLQHRVKQRFFETDMPLQSNYKRGKIWSQVLPLHLSFKNKLRLLLKLR